MREDPFSIDTTIRDVHGLRYRLAFTEPVSFGGTEHSHREGLLVCARSHGQEGWGDVAPLPGFSPESLEDALHDARSWGTSMENASVQVSRSHAGVDVRARTDGMAPSAAFGVESAVLDLTARRRGVPVPEMLTARPRPVVSINALLDGTPDQIRREAAALRDDGYRAVKVKVGRRDRADEAGLIRDLHDVLGPEVALRLDANRAWDRAEARAFAEAIRDVPIAYLEEPLADPTGLREFAEETGVAVALDETVREITPSDLREHAYAAAIVLKPSLTGLTATLRWMQEASECGVGVVFSSAFESGVGMRTLIALASASPKDVPAGMGPYRRLATDVLRSRLPLDGPTVDAGAVVRDPPEVAEERLQRVF